MKRRRFIYFIFALLLGSAFYLKRRIQSQVAPEDFLLALFPFLRADEDIKNELVKTFIEQKGSFFRDVIEPQFGALDPAQKQKTIESILTENVELRRGLATVVMRHAGALYLLYSG